MSSKTSVAGGLIGGWTVQSTSDSCLRNCANYGTVSAANTQAGGLIGYLSNGVPAANVLNAGSISAGSGCAGGIYGYYENRNAAATPFSGVVSVGFVSGTTQVGAVIGDFKNTVARTKSYVAEAVVLSAGLSAAEGGQTGVLIGGTEATSTQDFSLSVAESACSSVTADYVYYTKTGEGAELALTLLAPASLTDGSMVTMLNDFAVADETLSSWRQGTDFPELGVTGSAGPALGNRTVTVTFVDDDDTVLLTQEILLGSFAVLPEDPVKAGFVFLGWEGVAVDLIADATLRASWKQDELEKYDVRFLDWDGTVLQEEVITEGERVEAPADPTREGCVFTGWDRDFSRITGDLDVTAQYDERYWTVDSVERFVELVSIKTLPGYVLTLTTDLDLAATEWTSPDLVCTLDGNGHVVTGLGKKPLFEVVTGTVRGLVIRGNMQTGDAPLSDGIQNANYGLLARVVSNGCILGCSVESSIVAPSQGSSTGLLVGALRNRSLMEGCTTGVDCALVDSKASSVGGLVGRFDIVEYYENVGPTVRGCTNNAAIHLKNGPGARRGLGGIVGSSAAYEETGRPVSTIAECLNNGSMSCNEGQSYVCFGGIVGEVSCGTGSSDTGHLEVMDCINRGVLAAHGLREITAGGIVGGGGRASFVILRCANLGTVSALSDDPETNEATTFLAGGIIGTASEIYPSKPVTIADCANYAAVTSGAIAGGLIGEAVFNTTQQGQLVAGTNCVNHASVVAPLAKGEGFGRLNGAFPETAIVRHIGFTNSYFTTTEVIGDDGTGGKATLDGCRYGTESVPVKSIVRALSEGAETLGYASWVRGKSGPELALFGVPYDPALIITIR